MHTAQWDVDVLVVGAGVTGCAIARALAQYDIRLAVADACADVAMGASRANSAIVHAGYDCKPGSLMAKLNVWGNSLFERWCGELDVPLIRTGSLVIAFNEDEERELAHLYKQGLENGVPGMRLISGDEARALDPLLSSEVTRALHAATGAITCPYELTIACAENARDNGAKFLLSHRVSAIKALNGGFEVAFEGAPSVRARYIVNAAGLYADDVARLIGDTSYTILPRKGEYMLLDRNAGGVVRTVVFQTPSELGKGVLVAPTVDGNAFAGPTAGNQQSKTDVETTREGLAELVRLSKRSIPSIDLRAVITSFAGLRAQPSTGDFVIRPSEIHPNFLHAGGICSPGLSSAPAIGLYMAELLAGQGLALVAKPGYAPERRAIAAFRHMDDCARREAIAGDPRYGRVICRCETVTEAEIVQAVARGATTLDGIKRRTRAGMGRCQGGFCTPRAMEILSKELGVPMERLTKFGGKSFLIVGKLKEVGRDA